MILGILGDVGRSQDLETGRNSLKKRVPKYFTYNTITCVLQIKQGVHLAHRASKRHPKVAYTIRPLHGKMAAIQKRGHTCKNSTNSRNSTPCVRVFRI